MKSEWAGLAKNGPSHVASVSSSFCVPPELCAELKQPVSYRLLPNGCSNDLFFGH